MEESQQLFATGVIPLKGELTVGDDYTAGDFFIVSAFVAYSWRQMTTCCQTAERVCACGAWYRQKQCPDND